MVSARVPQSTGLLVSLAGDPVVFYLAQDAVTAFVGDSVVAGATTYQFAVSERLQYVLTEPTCRVRI